MAKLLWRDPRGRITEITERPFEREEEFERYVVDNRSVLGDVFPLKRQIRHGSKRGIPDIVGIDDAGQVVIVEMKNVTVGEDIVPQVLAYAIWAQRNPDSIKSLWLESPERPEDVEPNWEDLPVRIMIVAPSFKTDLGRMAAKINYPIEMVALRRFTRKRDEFLWLDRQVADPGESVRPVAGLAEYDRAFYESQHGKEGTAKFLAAVRQLAQVCRAQGWKLEEKANKNYVGFKRDGRVLFGIKWRGTRAWRLFVKVPDAVAKRSAPAGWKSLAYVQQFHEALFAPADEAKPRFPSVVPLLKMAWRDSEAGS